MAGTSVRAGLSSERGFTLLEMLVVFFVIAALIALTIPTLQGFRIRAQDRAVQTELRNAIILERGHWQEFGAYTNVAADLKQLDYTFQEGDGFTPYHPLLELDLGSSGQRICLTAQSDSGVWYSIMEEGTTGRTYYGDTQAVPCTASLATGYSEDGW
jgi:prepilin-type N-terminal cleavage/methylation domain-containing protein